MSMVRFVIAREFVTGLITRMLITIGSGAIAAGCATVGSWSGSAEELVLQRAQARWDALVERDFGAAYKYLSPAYRAVVQQRSYSRMFQGPVLWEGAKAKSAKCDEKRCTVLMEVSFRAAVPKHHERISSTHFEEVWVFEEGGWFKYEPI